MTVLPYKEKDADKKSQVRQMFDNIAGSYDMLNHLLSLGIDIWWRKQAVRVLTPFRPVYVLDVATGTADFALSISQISSVKHIVGVDIAEQMLEVGRDKISKRQLNEKISLQQGDSENLSFPDKTFDAVTVAFGVRNFAHLMVGLKEMYRVLKPGGVVMVLEFSKPKSWLVGKLYRFYFSRWVPWVGALISKDKSAYAYLPASVEVFPDGMQFAELLEKTGFERVQWRPLTFGICTLYWGVKPA